MKAVVICEGEVDEILEFKSKEEFETFRRGAEYGAGKYGCGDFGIYCLEDIGDWLKEDNPYDKKYVEMIRGALGEVQ